MHSLYKTFVPLSLLKVCFVWTILGFADCSGDKKVEIQSISPAELLKQHKQDMVRRRKSRQSGLPSLESPQNPKDVTPKLARGGSMDGFISLDMSKKAKPVSSTEIAKVLGRDFYVNLVHVELIVADVQMSGKTLS